MKKLLFSIIVTLLIVFSFTACNGETPPTPPEPDVEYTVTWIDESGKEIKKTSVKENEKPSNQYSVNDTAEWDYTFVGWSATQNGEVLTELPKATADATYYAIVTKEKVKYTVTFQTNGGSQVAAQSVEYGSLAVLPQEPTYDGHRFMGWCSDPALTTSVDWNAAIKGNVTYYASWNECVDILGLLRSLLSGYSLNPYSYIPETMRPTYSANLISSSDAISDYSDFVNISAIPSHGFGEQWNMILKNIQESTTFFNVLSAVEAVSASSVTIFNNYLDNNTSDTANHTFKDGIYNVTIKFDGNLMLYVLDYTATLPVLGEQSVQIALSMELDSAEKSVRIQLGDANALRYTIKENSYEFAIKYLGVRRAYFSVARDANDNVTGHIYEILTASGVELKSAADFYITDDYVTAVGNKADGMLGFTGYISETYDKSNGRLIGYEVQETLSAITYNTVWLDLDLFSGLQSIKYQEAVGDTPAKFFINGSSSPFATKNVGGIGLKMLSRRFDIEFRTQYFYSYNSDTEEYTEIKLSVPMLFIQEENYETFEDDFESTNNVAVELNVNNTDFNKMLSDYDTYIEPFIASKEAITSETIVNFIGTMITHQ